MKNTKPVKDKVVYYHFTDEMIVPILGGITAPVTIALSCVVEWCDNGQEWAFKRIIFAFACIGTDDVQNTPPSRFLPITSPRGEFVGMTQDHKNDICAAAASGEMSEVAKTVVQYWEEALEYNTVTITEAV